MINCAQFIVFNMKFAQFPHSEVTASQGGDMESEGSDLDE